MHFYIYMWVSIKHKSSQRVRVQREKKERWRIIRNVLVISPKKKNKTVFRVFWNTGGASHRGAEPPPSCTKSQPITAGHYGYTTELMWKAETSTTPWVHDTDIVVAHTTLLFHFINHVPFGNRPWTECQKWTQPLNFKATVNFQNFQIDKWNLTTIDWSSCRSHVMCFSNRFPLNRIIRCNKPTTVLLMNKVLGALWKCWLKNSRQQRTTPSIPQSVTVFMLLTNQSLQTNVNVLIGIHFLMCEK